MKINIVLIMTVIFVLTGCKSQTVQEKRSERAREAQGDIVIAAVWPWTSSKGTLWNGIEMAVDEINHQGGLLGGRHIRILKKDDKSTLIKGRILAEEITENQDVVAVIGHLNSNISILTSFAYERAGIVMLSPGSSGQELTENGLQYVFRNLPGNRDGGKQMAEYALEQGYKRVIIYYIKNEYGMDVANYFEQSAHKMGLTIVDRRSYNKAGDRFNLVLEHWSSLYKFDAIFLAGSLPESAQIINQARESGIDVPIFGGAGLDSNLLLTQGGSAVEGTVVFALYSPESLQPKAFAFNQRYRKRYQIQPDSAAAQGYDAVMLLAHSIKTAGSSAPTDIAKVLHETKGWEGVTGVHNYDLNGDLQGKELAKVVVENGRFTLLNSLQAEKRANE